MKTILLMMLAIFVACPAFAGCGSVSYISERDLDLEADVIFLASNPEGEEARAYLKGFGPGVVIFTVDKVFKGNLKESQKVDVEFLREYAHQEYHYLGALYVQTGIIAAKYDGASLVSIGSPEGMCKDIKVNRENLDRYFATEWNLTRLKSVIVRYKYSLKTMADFYRFGIIHAAGVGLLILSALIFFMYRSKTAAKN